MRWGVPLSSPLQGYGFVQYTEPEMAQAAVLSLHGSYVGDNCLSCKLADRDKDRGAQNQPSNNLYIGNLPTNWGVVEVSEVCRRAGEHGMQCFPLAVVRILWPNLLPGRAE